MDTELAKMTIRVIGFKTTYEKHPKRGTDPLRDKVDAQGFLLDASGNRVMENVAEDWAIYAPAHSPLNTKNVERVRFLRPDPSKIGQDDDGARFAFMQARWSQIEPAYEAWKKGQDVPVNGMSLSAWPGLNPEQVAILRQVGLQTVEDIRDLSETSIGRVPLPNMREMKRQAAIFLENLGAADAAEREASKDERIASMEAQLAELKGLLDQKTEPPKVDGDEAENLRAELDRLGVEYDKKWAAPKLRQVLLAAKEAA